MCRNEHAPLSPPEVFGTDECEDCEHMARSVRLQDVTPAVQSVLKAMLLTWKTHPKRPPIADSEIRDDWREVCRAFGLDAETGEVL